MQTSRAFMKNLTSIIVAAIAGGIMDLFTLGPMIKFDIVYNKFRNAATQIVMTEHFYHCSGRGPKPIPPADLYF